MQNLITESCSDNTYMRWLDYNKLINAEQICSEYIINVRKGKETNHWTYLSNVANIHITTADVKGVIVHEFTVASIVHR